MFRLVPVSSYFSITIREYTFFIIVNVYCAIIVSVLFTIARNTYHFSLVTKPESIVFYDYNL